MIITVEELIKYSETHKFKKETLIIRKGATVTNRKQYFMSNLAVVRGNRGNKTFKPYYDRLLEFMKIVKDEQDRN